MRRVFSIILCLGCLVCSAKEYKITSIKDVQIRLGSNIVKEGDTFDTEKDKFDATWQKSEGYYILKDVATGVTSVIRQPSTTSAQKSESYLSKLRNFLTSVKNCSSRAAENELFGGLDSYLSQTFYLSLSDSNLAEIYVATDLVQNEECYFKLRRVDTKYSRDIRVSPSRGFRVTPEDVKAMTGSDEPVRLRCRVSYVSANGQEIVITETMNLILLK